MTPTQAPLSHSNRVVDAPPSPWVILAVDDVPDVLDSFKQLLEQSTLGVKVITAASGKIGLDILAREHVDLIMSDAEMPRMDGIEFLSHARRIRPAVPRVLFASFASEVLSRRAVSPALVDLVLSKSLSPLQMVQKIEGLLRPGAAVGGQGIDGEAATPRDAAKPGVGDARTPRSASVALDPTDAITVQDLQGRIERWNGGAERMYGYSEAEALRMNASQLVPEAERQRSLDIIRQIRTGEPVDPVEAQHVTKDGRRLDVWLTVSKVLDGRQRIAGIATTARDITQRKKEDRQLRLFASVVLDSNDAITVQALDGRVEAWNRAAERMYGYTEAEALGMNAMQLVPETERERVLDLVRQIRTGEPVGSVELKRVTKDGRTLDVWLTLSKVLDDRQQIVGVATTERDVTDRKRLEAEIRMNQSLEIERFKELDELKTLFINTAAHELRTPLTPLKLQLHALRSGMRGALTPEQKHTVGILTRNFDRLGQLIEDVLDVGRLQAGHLYIQPETLAVDQVVCDVVESFREMSRKGGVSMTCRIEPGLKVQADHKRLTQVLFNILENALKFTAEGGTIQVVAEGAGSNVEIRVTDTGVGLRQQDIARLFRPFTQIHDPMQRTRGGSGLGLYICSGLIQLHGGTITCTSPGVGQGTTFTISLPVVSIVGPAQGPAAGDS